MTSFEEQVRMLRARFVGQAAADAAEIERQAATGAWRAVRDLSHGIIGRAGMFGFPALSDTARALEQAVDDGASPEQLRLLARTLVADLRALADRP